MSQTEDDILQRICGEVEGEFEVLHRGGKHAFAREVARRYAAMVGGVPEEVKQAVLNMTEDAKQPIYGSNIGWGEEAVRIWWETAGGQFEREEDALGVYAALTFLDKLLASPTTSRSKDGAEG